MTQSDKHHEPAETAKRGEDNHGKLKPESNHHEDSERLDEGLEETFPASDPVAAKHIT